MHDCYDKKFSILVSLKNTQSHRSPDRSRFHQVSLICLMNTRKFCQITVKKMVLSLIHPSLTWKNDANELKFAVIYSGKIWHYYRFGRFGLAQFLKKNYHSVILMSFAMQNANILFIFGCILKLKAIEGTFENRITWHYFLPIYLCSLDT